MPIRNLTALRLYELFCYNPMTGVFTRRINAHKGRFKAGTVSGSYDARGYLTIWIDGASYKAHRLAWLYATGRWPDGEIDHRDGVRDNNAILNLRPVSRAQNEWNKGLRSHNRSGRNGVYLSKGKFHAHIEVHGQKKWLGAFDDLCLAAKAREEAEKKFFGSYAHKPREEK